MIANDKERAAMVPPCDENAERAFIGSLFFMNSAIDVVRPEPEIFYFSQNQVVAETILTLWDSGCKAIDAVIVAEELARKGRLEDAGGVPYLVTLAESVPHAEHVRYYAKIVREKFQRRQLIYKCEQVLSEARRPDNDIQHIVDHAAKILQESRLQPHSRLAFNGKTAAALWDLDDGIEWLVDGVFSADQPTIFGAKQKSLKTTLLTDLAVCLPTGFPWLGRFTIPKKRRVLFITGEASEKAAIRKIKRAAKSRNLRREDLGDGLRIEAITFPTLPSDKDCAAVAEAVKENGIEVVLLDPLYMGLQGLNTANLNEVGPAMKRFMEHCRPARVIIAHHVKKTASFDDAPNLEDLSQAGIAEFAGNYWLMGRMSEYMGDGMHSLAIRYGGRDEQFGLLKLEFDERDWKAEFTSLVDHREDQKQRRENERVNAQLQAVKGHLNRHDGQATLRALAEAAATKPNRDSFQRLVDELCDSGQYERFQTKGGNNKVCEALRVKGQKSTDSVP